MMLHLDSASTQSGLTVLLYLLLCLGSHAWEFTHSNGLAPSAD